MSAGVQDILIEVSPGETRAAFVDAEGRLVGFTKVTRDTSERRQLEQERETALEALASANRELESLNERLQRAADDQAQFLAVTAHELRTPITAIRLQVRGVRRVAGGNNTTPGLAPALNERLSRVERSMARLSQLVDSLLDVSRIATGKLKLHPEPIDLGKLARQVIEYIEPDAERAGVELALVELSPTQGSWDLLRIEQVLMNLVSNALKFGAGRPITLEVGTYPASDTEPQRAFLRVIDHGIGVSPADAERIFGKFERSVPARQYGGLGLGLYISRQIVEAHDGTISVRPTPGGGATFEVTLPLA